MRQTTLEFIHDAPFVKKVNYTLHIGFVTRFLIKASDHLQVSAGCLAVNP